MPIAGAMKFLELFISELDREVKPPSAGNGTQRQAQLKPHDKSMEFGYLADMVATIPTWFTMIIKQEELDVAPKGGSRPEQPQPKTSAEYIRTLEDSARQAKEALEGTSEAHLQTHWKLLAAALMTRAEIAQEHHKPLDLTRRSRDGLLDEKTTHHLRLDRDCGIEPGVTFAVAPGDRRQVRPPAWRDRTGSDSLQSLRGTGNKIAGGTGALTSRQSQIRSPVVPGRSLRGLINRRGAVSPWNSSTRTVISSDWGRAFGECRYRVLNGVVDLRRKLSAACASTTSRSRFLPKNPPLVFCASVTPSL